MAIYKSDRGVELVIILTGASNRSAALPSRSSFRVVWGKPSLGAPASWSDESQTASLLSFSSDLVRAVHARGSGEASSVLLYQSLASLFPCLAFCLTEYTRRSTEKRDTASLTPVSRHQSCAWPFVCLAFSSTDSRKKRDSQSRRVIS